MYWVSHNTRRDEKAPRPIFITKSQKEKEAEKQAKLSQQKKAELSASATIAAEKRATTRISTGGTKFGGATGSKSPPTRITRK